MSLYDLFNVVGAVIFFACLAWEADEAEVAAAGGGPEVAFLRALGSTA